MNVTSPRHKRPRGIAIYSSRCKQILFKIQLKEKLLKTQALHHHTPPQGKNIQHRQTTKTAAQNGRKIRTKMKFVAFLLISEIDRFDIRFD